MVDLPDEDLNVSSWVNVLLTESISLAKVNEKMALEN